MHLRNAPTGLMKHLGYGEGYRNPHDTEDGFVGVPNLPEQLVGRRFYEPTETGAEAELAKRLAALRGRRKTGSGA
jgi:putative ATPase